MKKIIALFMLMFIMLACAVAEAPTDVDIVYTFEGPRTLTWDPVTESVGGEPILPADVITYEVFFKDSTTAEVISAGIVDPTVTGNIMPDTLNKRAWYYVGVEAILTPEVGEVTRSGVAWSNTLVAVDPTQRFAYYVQGITPILLLPTGLRIVEP